VRRHGVLLRFFHHVVVVLTFDDGSARALNHLLQHAADVLSAEPFDEMGCQALMRAHAAAGNRAEALRVFANCRKLFRDELGAEPSEQTAAVFLSILRAG
jgi:DNA-binding SARP family transcriptional activator